MNKSYFVSSVFYLVSAILCFVGAALNFSLGYTGLSVTLALVGVLNGFISFVFYKTSKLNFELSPVKITKKI